MKIANEFTVHTPIDRAWRVLTDLEGIAPCMPGAQLTGVDGDVYQGKVRVKVGPVISEFAGTARFTEKDDAAYRGVIDAKGRDARSAGNAAALVTAVLRQNGDSTTVSVDTDLKISGKLAQFGSGMIKEVSGKLLAQFVANLEAKLAADDATAPAADSVPPGDPANPADAVDPANPADAVDAVGALDAVHAVGALDGVDPVGAVDGLDAVGAVDRVDPVDAVGRAEVVGAVDAVGAVDGVDAGGAADRVDSVGAVDRVDSVDAVDSVNHVDAVDAVGSVDGINTVNTVNLEAPDAGVPAASQAAAGEAEPATDVSLPSPPASPAPVALPASPAPVLPTASPAAVLPTASPAPVLPPASPAAALSTASPAPVPPAVSPAPVSRPVAAAPVSSAPASAKAGAGDPAAPAPAPRLLTPVAEPEPLDLLGIAGGSIYKRLVPVAVGVAAAVAVIVWLVARR